MKTKPITAVPRLRFPEFQDDEAWEIKKLENLAENLDFRRVPITKSDRTKGNIPYYGASGIIDYVKDYIFDEELLCISEDGANLIDRVYPIAFSVSGKSWVNNHAHVLRFKQKPTQSMVESFLNFNDISSYLTGMAQPKLNKQKLNSIKIPLPTILEQHKIATCLSSLDDSINAEIQQLDSLKTHKAGLLQKLFPVGEETVPKYRFPEFESDGDWNIEKLGDVCEFQQGIQVGIELQSKTPKQDYVRFIRIENYTQQSQDFRYVPNNLVRDKFILKNEVAIVRYGATAGFIGRGLEGVLANNLFKVTPKEKFLDSDYLHVFLKSANVYDFFQSEMTGAAMPALSFGIVGALNIAVPNLEEQRKIASFVSSLDNLIGSQTKKIKILKQHKQGLMQQLFPINITSK